MKLGRPQTDTNRKLHKNLLYSLVQDVYFLMNGNDEPANLSSSVQDIGAEKFKVSLILVIEESWD
jgi:hypothetical protein